MLSSGSGYMRPGPAIGPEIIAGSTRLKAGTAQKIALNIFSTGVMLQLGRVYRGLMVDMRPSNAKLRQRAERMVGSLAGCEGPAAADALATAKGETPGMPKLKTVLKELGDMLTNEQYDEFIDNIAYFHQVLVEATGNKTLSFMNRMLLNLARTHHNDYQHRNPY